MANRAVERGLLKTAEVGRNKVKISHIQYADDTLFITEGGIEKAKAIKWILKNFELASGLSVNFDKSLVFGLDMDREDIATMAEKLECRVRVFPITYLGLKVGGRRLGTETWGDPIEKVKGRIRSWDRKGLSMGGRITVIKSILSALPIYGLSILPMPKKVSQQIQGLLCNFLWGGDENGRKVPWIKW